MDGIIGEIRAWANSFVPRYWMSCEGQILPIRSNTALFSVLGTTYGGDGTVTFGLPNLLGCVPLGTGFGPGLTERRLGEFTGSPTIVLTQSQLPSHRHSVPVSGAAASTASPANAYPGASELIKPYAASADAVMAAAAVAFAGDNQPHDNMQPYLAVRYIICVNGMFPRRW
jgi:microcystin-dependent protein